MTILTNEQIVALVDMEVFKTPARDTDSRNKRIAEGKKLQVEYNKVVLLKLLLLRPLLKQVVRLMLFR